jgi:signal transduction histidine kinase
MHCTRPTPRCNGRLLAAWLCALLASWAASLPATAQQPAVAAADPKPWRVVILQGVDPAQPAMQQYDRAFRGALLAAAPGPVTFFTDTLDSPRFPGSTLEPEFLALVTKKYASQPVDLVVGVGDGSVDFLERHHATLWPGAPVVLSAIDETKLRGNALSARTPSVAWKLDIDGTLDLVEKLQPAARRLVVIGGNSEVDQQLVASVTGRAGLRPLWQVEAWRGLTVTRLREQLAALDSGSAVIFTTMYRDAGGRASFPADALARFADASRAPIYGLYGTYIGRGAVAGQVVDFEDTGRRTAALAAGLLQGQPLPASAWRTLAPTRCVADYTPMAALGLRVSDLPAGCELRNAPRNLWSEYRAVVLVAAAVLLLQALTIATLLVQRRRRQQAEADALQRRSELSRAMRFAAIGELTASIAHEINQPLGAILSNADAAELLLKAGKATPEDLREILADIRRDDLRAHEVIRRLRALLEKHEVEHRDLHLHPVLDDVLALLAPEARRRGVSIDHAFEAADDRLHGDPVQLQQVLLNLGLNALDAMEPTEPARRRLRITTADRGDRLELTVADRGHGIEPARRQTVFESFYTTKPRGLGLGLPIVRAIVEAHQGNIAISPNEGGGTVFTVTLPRRLIAHAAAATSISTNAAPGLIEGAS